MAWTEAQERAIEARGRNLLVAAAAGSGKTAVLVQRVIGMVMSGECDVDELLVVTFTRAAAEEMRARIGSALEKSIVGERDGERISRLERQMVLLSGASITTIDSFCQSILRRNFSKLDLDPQFRIAGEQELRLLQQDVLEELFEEKYDAEENEEFLRFADGYGGNERGDDALYQILLKLYGFSQSQPFPEEWLAGLAAPFQLAQGLSDTPWYDAVMQEVCLALAEAREENARAMELADRLGADFYVRNLEADREYLESLQDAAQGGNWEILRAAFGAGEFGKLKSAPKGTEDAVKKPVQAARDAAKKVVKSIQEKYFLVTEEEQLEDLHAAGLAVSALAGMAVDFLHAYAAAKRERSVVDFSDLEHYALQILSNGGQRDGEGRLIPSKAAMELQQKYKAVMVDEYQDTNGVQEAILHLVARPETGNFFAVGDVKQSIYRFRLADPGLFLEKYRSYPERGEKYGRIDLSMNFRSRPEVLAAVNFIFSQVMVEGAMELAYDDAALLHPGLALPDSPRPLLRGPAELALLVDGEQDGESSEETGEDFQPDGEDANASPVELRGAAREAWFIARRLREIRDEGTMVYDSATGKYRPFQWRDAVILMRSLRGAANEMLEVLRRNNIPAYASVDAGYFEEQEVRIMLALLTVLDNARQDIPLAAVLVSPIGGMSYEDLARIRLAAPEEDLYGALLASGHPDAEISRELSERAAGMLERLSRWRSLAREVGVPELIWQLYRDTGYYDYVGGLPGGLLRQANLRMLVDRASAYERTAFRGLFRFLRFVERMQDMDTDLAVARTLGESEDVVRIMSIHKSKGLEFPVVFVASLGRKFNLMDTSRPPVLMHRELGLGPCRVLPEGPLAYPTFARQAVRYRIMQESKAEELRILYVALTRAREKVVLVGSVGKETQLDKRAGNWCSYGVSGSRPLPDYAPLGADCFLDWIGMALSRHPDGALIRRRAGLDEVEEAHVEPDSFRSRWQVCMVSDAGMQHHGKEQEGEDAVLSAVREGKPLPETGQKESVEALLDWSYDTRGLSDVPAKLSVTELKRRFSEREPGAASLWEKREQMFFRRPDFIQERGLTGAEQGTLMHSVMQHLFLDGRLDATDIREQLARMEASGILLPDQVPLVRARDIQRFFASPMGMRIRKARELYRELPFSRMVSAKRFYPEVQDSEEQIFVQGIIDVLFLDQEGKLVLLDYKTDRDPDPARAASRYRLQVELYSEAVEELMGRAVDEKYLYLIRSSVLVPMDKQSSNS